MIISCVYDPLTPWYVIAIIDEHECIAMQITYVHNNYYKFNICTGQITSPLVLISLNFG